VPSYGVMIPLLALKKLVKSLLATV
jgi:hypothetical protein